VQDDDDDDDNDDDDDDNNNNTISGSSWSSDQVGPGPNNISLPVCYVLHAGFW
jgi:hypothetical protein